MYPDRDKNPGTFAYRADTLPLSHRDTWPSELIPNPVTYAPVNLKIFQWISDTKDILETTLKKLHICIIYVSYLRWAPNETLEKMWPDRDLNLEQCGHSTIDLPSHLVISPTTFHLKPNKLHIKRKKIILNYMFCTFQRFIHV